MKKLNIDDGFKRLIPKLSDEEYALLEENIIAEGCRESLIVWQEEDVLLDGHNRYAICTAHDIDFDVSFMTFNNRDDAERWIIRNQLGRRNLKPDDASLLRARLYESLKKPHGGQVPGTSMGKNCPSSTAEVVAQQTGVSERTVKNDVQFAKAVDTLKDAGIDADEFLNQVSRKAVMEAARETTPEAAREKLSKPHQTQGTGNNEWYTPPEIIEAARKTMGGIDCDPASSKVANKTVKAKSFFTVDDNGISRKWDGRVWMNPPFSQPEVSQFSDAVAEKFESGEIKQACVLTNNATETIWAQRLMEVASAICFPRARVRFLDQDGNPRAGALQGQMIVYLGGKIESFRVAFEKIGSVWVK
jgi:ParB family chromosome partitioning protein